MELIPHPANNNPPPGRLSATCARVAPDVLLLRYCLEGELAWLRLAPPTTPQRADDLWRHTCLEAFIQPQDPTGHPAPPPTRGKSRYSEFNLAPSTLWAAYAFDAYRANMRPLSLPRDPLIAVQVTRDSLTLTARITLPAPDAKLPLAVGLTAVIETRDGDLSWWALRHSSNKPDFHRCADFIFEC